MEIKFNEIIKLDKYALYATYFSSQSYWFIDKIDVYTAYQKFFKLVEKYISKTIW